MGSLGTSVQEVRMVLQHARLPCPFLKAVHVLFECAERVVKLFGTGRGQKGTAWACKTR